MLRSASEDVDMVLLVGGRSSIPCFKPFTIVKGEMPHACYLDTVNAHNAIALEAARHI